MTTAIFLMLLAVFAIISSFLTQGVKKFFTNMNKPYSANMIALVNAAILGCGGTIVAYMLLSIPFTLVNIAFIPIMVGLVWLGSMLGYDKVTQLITQILAMKKEG